MMSPVEFDSVFLNLYGSPRPAEDVARRHRDRDAALQTVQQPLPMVSASEDDKFPDDASFGSDDSATADTTRSFAGKIKHHGFLNWWATGRPGHTWPANSQTR